MIVPTKSFDPWALGSLAQAVIWVGAQVNVLGWFYTSMYQSPPKTTILAQQRLAQIFRTTNLVIEF